MQDEEKTIRCLNVLLCVSFSYFVQVILRTHTIQIDLKTALHPSNVSSFDWYMYNVHIGPLYNTHVCVPCIHLILSVSQPLCKQSLCMWFLMHFHKFRFGFRFIQKKNEWICLPLLHFISGWLSFSTFFSFTQLCRFIWNPFFSHFASFFFIFIFTRLIVFPFSITFIFNSTVHVAALK